MVRADPGSCGCRSVCTIWLRGQDRSLILFHVTLWIPTLGLVLICCWPRRTSCSFRPFFWWANWQTFCFQGIALLSFVLIVEGVAPKHCTLLVYRWLWFCVLYTQYTAQAPSKKLSWKVHIVPQCAFHSVKLCQLKSLFGNNEINN